MFFTVTYCNRMAKKKLVNYEFDTELKAEQFADFYNSLGLDSQVEKNNEDCLCKI